MRKIVSLVGVAVLAFSAALWAQEDKAPESLEAYVPSDAALYVHYQGLTNAAKTFEQTELVKLVKEEDVQEFGAELSRVMDELMKRPGNNSRLRWEDLRLLLDCEMAFGLLDVRGRVPSIVLVVRAGGNADKVRDMADRFLAGVTKLPPDQALPEDEMEAVRFKRAGPLCAAWLRDDLVFTTGQETLRRVVRTLKGFENSIAKNDRYAAAAAKLLGGREFLRAHWDVERTRALTSELQRAERFDNFYKATGLKDVNYLHLAVAPDAPGVKAMLYAHAPQGARGVFGLLPSKPLDEKASLAALDASAPDFIIARMSPVELFDAFAGIATGVDRRGDFDDAIERFNRRAGFDLRAQLLASLGDRVLLRTVGAGLQVAASVDVKDEKAVSSCLDKLLAAAAEEAAGAGADGRPGVAVEKLAHRGRTITVLKLTGAAVPMSPSWAVSDGKLLIALTPQSLKKALDLQGVRPARPFADSDSWRALRAHVGPRPSVLAYDETRRNFETIYGGILTPMAQMFNGAKTNLPPNSLAAKLPAVDAVAPHLFASLMALSRDDEGYLFESYGPAANASSMLASFAVVNIIVRPALARGREAARRTAGMSNLKQIGTAIEMYRNEHNGTQPESFGALRKGGYIGNPKVFLSPNGRGRVPADYPAGNFKDADLVKLNAIDDVSDYTLVKNPKADRADQTPLAYENAPFAGGGRCVLFADGHVEFKPEDQFRALVEKKPAP